MHVLVAVDESPISERAAREAVRLFGRPDSTFHFLNTRQLLTYYAPESFGAMGPWPFFPSVENSVSEEDLAKFARELGRPNAQIITETGDPVQVICAVAERLNADVIVVGSHDKGLWERMVHPSVSGAVVRATHRPVLVVSGDEPKTEPQAQ